MHCKGLCPMPKAALPLASDLRYNHTLEAGTEGERLRRWWPAVGSRNSRSPLEQLL